METGSANEHEADNRGSQNADRDDDLWGRMHAARGDGLACFVGWFDNHGFWAPLLDK
jgi:hypothetical protein